MRSRSAQYTTCMVSHLNPAMTVDSPAGNVVLAGPLHAEAFAPFGDVIDASGMPDTLIHAGACRRFHDRARLAVDSAGRLGVSVIAGRCHALPITIEMPERHPLASQAFLPMSADPFLVVVALDRDGEPGTPRAFLTRPGQDVNLLRGTWHGVPTPLGSSGLFAVVHRVGSGENCEVRRLAQPFAVGERQ